MSKQGNIESIKSDFKKAIEDAYLQGIISKSSIENYHKYSFEDSQKIDVINQLKHIIYIYVVCILLDPYPALTHSSRVLLYDKYEEPTICMTVFDLEIISHFLKEHNQFFDYFKKRVTNCKYYISENELCFLGFYLEHDLKPASRLSGVMIPNDYGGTIDHRYYPVLSESTSFKNSSDSEDHKNNIEKVGRNELCPCGSGKKRKHCHRN